MKFSSPSWKVFAKEKIFSVDEVAGRITKARKEGGKVALLNGSFDLLHAGHLHILYEASQAADVLIVALNSDASIKRYKGVHRPIVSLQNRMEMVAALSFVDYVTWFEEDDPRAIIRILRPDVHVNGSEYGENCVEASTVKECGGTLLLVDRIPGLATSTLIETVQTLCDK